MQITYQELQAKGACANQLALFKKHFGPSVVVTLEAVLAVADVFNWDWAARNLMSPKACKVYQDAIAPACKVYDDAIAPAQKAYRDAKMPIWKAYEDAIANRIGTPKHRPGLPLGKWIDPRILMNA